MVECGPRHPDLYALALPSSGKRISDAYRQALLAFKSDRKVTGSGLSLLAP
jgi:hypothetical protein